MTSARFRFVFTTKTHAAIQVGSRRLTPLSRTVGVKTPWGGWSWRFPLAVDVEEAGNITRLVIPDPTRLALIALVVAVWLALFLEKRRA